MTTSAPNKRKSRAATDYPWAFRKISALALDWLEHEGFKLSDWEAFEYVTTVFPGLAADYFRATGRELTIEDVAEQIRKILPFRQKA